MHLLRMLRLWKVLTKLKEDPTMKEKIKSRKLWISVFGAMLVAVNAGLGYPVPDTTINDIVMLLMTYVGGQAVADAAGNFNKGGKE